MRKRLRLSLWIGLGVALLYVGYTFTDRYLTNRRLEQLAGRPPDKLPAALATNELKILQFYAMPGVVAAGEKAVLCYGVLNAKSVELDPPIERVWPAFNRCFDVHPLKDTRYLLRARDATGKTVSESFLLKVERRR